MTARLRFQMSPIRFPLHYFIWQPYPGIGSLNRNFRGFPSSSVYLFMHATACGLRRFFTSLPLIDASVSSSVYVKTLDNPQCSFSKLYQLFRYVRHPCGLHDSLPTLRDISFATSPDDTPPCTQGSIRVAG